MAKTINAQESPSTIKLIKSRIIAMLEERQLLQNKEKQSSPSQYWSDYCSYFDYLLELPEDYFTKLRLHTYHLTGDSYQYYFGGPESLIAPEILRTFREGVPDRLILNEPPGGIGRLYPDGHFLSNDVLRFQTALNTLYREGLLDALPGKSKTERNLILEIGSGYGGFAYHLSRLIENVTCVLVDIPETLLFSASYLSLQNPEKKIYIYDKRDFIEFINSKEALQYDFILIPNYQLQALSHLRFKLVINIASLQEMRTDQVEPYLDFIQKTCEGVFYSWNQARNPLNSELSDLRKLIAKRFTIKEIFERENKSNLSLMQRIKKGRSAVAYWLHRLGLRLTYEQRQYICKPRG